MNLGNVNSDSRLASSVEDVLRWVTGQVRLDCGPVKLPSERELSLKFDLSRRQVRRAIDVLADRGYVVRRQGSGSYLVPLQEVMDRVMLVKAGDIMGDDPFYGGLLDPVATIAGEKGIEIVPISADGRRRVEESLPAIVLGKLDAGQWWALEKVMPFVVVLGDGGVESACSIEYDNEWIGREAVGQALARGHREILVLAGPERYRCAELRLQGALKRVDEASVALTVYPGKMNWRGGYDAMRMYLSQVERGRRCSAVVAGNDWMAAGALQALREAGVSVGREMSVIGCDDVALASQLEPALATFRLDGRAIVEQAFGILEQQRRLELELPRRIVLRAEFVLRGSLGQRM